MPVFKGKVVKHLKTDQFKSCCLVWDPELPPDDFGTGVWIGGEFVLTADHVVTDTLCVSLPLLDAEKRNRHQHRVKRVFRRKKSGYGGAPDLALLQLEHEVKSAGPAPKLADFAMFKRASQNGGKITLCGFGFGDREDKASIANDHGVKRFGHGIRVLHESEDVQFDQNYEFVGIGTGRPKVDTCEGDSGGPVYFQDQKKLVVIGITRARAHGENCGQGGIYTRVDANLEWILKHTS